MTIADNALLVAIAEALGRPITLSHDGVTLLVSAPKLASQIATLTELQLESLGINDVTGLEWAINLRALNLVNNAIDGGDAAGLGRLVPAIEPVSRSPIGLARLEYLSLDFNGGRSGVPDSLNFITDITALGTLQQLKALSLDYNSLTGLDALQSLQELMFLSLDGVDLSDVLPVLGTQIERDRRVTARDGMELDLKAGTLVLNAGVFAWRRLTTGGVEPQPDIWLRGDGLDGAEVFTIRQVGALAEDGTATIEVTAFGQKTVFTGVTAIYMDGGFADDQLLVNETGQDLGVRVLAMGGVGDDTLEGGSAPDRLWGGAGNDVLRGGGNADILTGDAGDDLLEGGDGDDTLDGGTGVDQLFGGAGENQFVIGDGLDFIEGHTAGQAIRITGPTQLNLAVLAAQQLGKQFQRNQAGLNTPQLIGFQSLLLGASPADLTFSLGTLPSGNIELNGHTATFTPADGFLGATSFTFTVTNPGGGVLTTTVPMIVSDAEPNLVFDGKGEARFIDADGTLIRLSLSGPGVGQVFFGADGHVERIELAGTTAKTSLRIRSDRGGDGRVLLGSLFVDGSIKQIDARTTDLSGDVTILGGASVIRMGNLTDANTITIGSTGNPKAKLKVAFGRFTDLVFESATPISTFTVIDWRDTDATPDRLAAPSLHTFKASGDKGNFVAGDVAASFELSDAAAKVSLGSATIAGQITAGTWDAASLIKSITAAGTGDAWRLEADAGVNKVRTKAGDLQGSMTALWFGAIQSSADLGAAINATGMDHRGVSIKKLAVPGMMDGADVRVAGTIKSATAGAVIDSQVTAGLLAALQGRPQSAADFVNRLASIDRFNVKGVRGGQWPSFVNTTLAAWNLGRVQLAQVQPDNGGAAHGLIAHTLKNYARRADAGLVKPGGLNVPGIADEEGDFLVQVI